MTRGQKCAFFWTLADMVKPHDAERAAHLTNLGCLVMDGYDAKPEPTCYPQIVNNQKRLVFNSEIISQRDILPALMSGATDPLDVEICSVGGDGPIALEIAKAIVARGNTTTIIRKALSAAAFIAVAGQHRKMYSGGRILLHPVMSIIAGTSEQLRERADKLDDLSREGIEFIAQRSGQGLDTVTKWFQTRTVFGAAAAKNLGLIDEVIP